jgi:hypothetical protein
MLSKFTTHTVNRESSETCPSNKNVTTPSHLGPSRSGLAGYEGLVGVERCVDLDGKRLVLANAMDDGSHDNSGLDDEPAGAISGDHHSFHTFEEFPDAYTAAIVYVKDYGMRFHGFTLYPSGEM